MNFGKLTFLYLIDLGLILKKILKHIESQTWTIKKECKCVYVNSLVCQCETQVS